MVQSSKSGRELDGFHQDKGGGSSDDDSEDSGSDS